MQIISILLKLQASSTKDKKFEGDPENKSIAVDSFT
jgi:hypothetical protein